MTWNAGNLSVFPGRRSASSGIASPLYVFLFSLILGTRHGFLARRPPEDKIPRKQEKPSSVSGRKSRETDQIISGEAHILHAAEEEISLFSDSVAMETAPS